MKKVILETAQVHTDFREDGPNRVKMLVDRKEIDVIARCTRPERYLFTKIVKAMKIPQARDQITETFSERGIIFQAGCIEAYLDTETGIAEVQFWVYETQEDCFHSLTSTYQEHKARELERIQKAAELAGAYDPQDSQSEQSLVVRAELECIMEESILLKSPKDATEIEKLEFKIPEADEPVFNGLVVSRIKQAVDDARFDFSQVSYDAICNGIVTTSSNIVIIDAQGAEQQVWIPVVFLNKRYHIELFALALSRRTFKISFSSPEVLKLSKSASKAATPSNIQLPFDSDEALLIIQAFHEGRLKDGSQADLFEDEYLEGVA